MSPLNYHFPFYMEFVCPFSFVYLLFVLYFIHYTGFVSNDSDHIISSLEVFRLLFCQCFESCSEPLLRLCVSNLGFTFCFEPLLRIPVSLPVLHDILFRTSASSFFPESLSSALILSLCACEPHADDKRSTRFMLQELLSNIVRNICVFLFL